MILNLPASRRFREWWRGHQLEEQLEVFVLPAAVISIPLVVLEELGNRSPVLVGADWLVWSVFALEYGLCFVDASDKWAYVRRRWLWLLIVVVSFPLLPALFGSARFVRLLRLVRIFGLGWRGLDAMRSVFARRGLVYVALLTSILVLFGGGLMSDLEPYTVRGGFWSGVWWAMVTVTTVGYGDISPRTLDGRLVAAALMMCGIGLTATLSAAVAARFVGDDDRPKIDELTYRLEAIEAKLDQLLDDRSPDPVRPPRQANG
ncbi:MAG: potassium channel family protein [Candidatus Dormibacteraeota bacterium]|nr:potassium channel family protein [Candidatus Dormibacteraeota bacterium]